MESEDEPQSHSSSPRLWRALTLGALSLLTVATAGASYLHPGWTLWPAAAPANISNVVGSRHLAAVDELKRDVGLAVDGSAFAPSEIGQSRGAIGGLDAKTHTDARAATVEPEYQPWTFGRAAIFDAGEAGTPLKRLPSVDEIARLALFLVCDATSITGELMVIDGGLTHLGALQLHTGR